MPLQTYDQYFGKSPPAGESFTKGFLTGEAIKNNRFNNALRGEQNQRLKAQEGRALETHERGKVEASQADQDREREFLASSVGALDTETDQGFIDSFLVSPRQTGEAIIKALGDTPEAEKMIMMYKKMRDKMLPKGMQGPVDMEAVKNGRKYFALIQKQLGVEKKSDYKEGETRTYNKDREEITEEYKNGQWVQKAKSPKDKPEDKEDKKIRTMNARANLMLAQAALKKANKGIDLEPKDIEILEGWLLDLEKKKDGIGWSVKELSKEEKAMELEIKQVLRKFPTQFLGAQGGGGVDNPPPPVDQPPQYASPEDVGTAFQKGEITREEARKILEQMKQ